MIRNVIFDLGNVLFSFRPAEFLDKKKYSESLKSLVLADIFGSKEWLMLDNGDITTAEAIDAIAMKSLLEREEIVRIFNFRREIIFPLDVNLKVLPVLKEQGFKLYFLSNFPVDLWEDVHQYEFFRHFEGGLISGKAGASKPESRIYEMLLKNYNLVPHECLYIDDLEANVKTAESLGMIGITTYGSLRITELINDTLSSAD